MKGIALVLATFAASTLSFTPCALGGYIAGDKDLYNAIERGMSSPEKAFQSECQVTSRDYSVRSVENLEYSRALNDIFSKKYPGSSVSCFSGGTWVISSQSTVFIDDNLKVWKTVDWTDSGMKIDTIRGEGHITSTHSINNYFITYDLDKNGIVKIQNVNLPFAANNSSSTLHSKFNNNELIRLLNIFYTDWYWHDSDNNGLPLFVNAVLTSQDAQEKTLQRLEQIASDMEKKRNKVTKKK